MHSLWFVQWDFTRRDHPRNPGGVSGSGRVLSVGLRRDVCALHCGVGARYA